MVYVLNRKGQPLMPTENHAKVRVLLKTGKAKVVKRCPFTIKLLYDVANYTDALTHGIDTGSAHIGSSVDATGKIYYLSEIEIRNDIKETMDGRRKSRRNRRNRKTRYRKPRFKNRKNSRRKNRFSPTMQHKIAAHEREIRFVKKILPITNLVLETGQFDMHLMKRPELAIPSVKPWGYQQGTLYGFSNSREYVLYRDNHTCQHCKGKRKDRRLEVHHIIFRRNGGSDDPKNLITLCSSCHTDLHDDKFELKLKGMKRSALRHATQMNCIRKQLLRAHPEATETFGYITKQNRIDLHLEKTHWMDAAVISSGGEKFIISDTLRLIRKNCVNRHDYQKTKGVRSEHRIRTGKILGFRKFDKVEYFGKQYFIKGRMTTGYAVLMDVNGEKADFSYMPKGSKTPKLSKCKRVEARSRWMIIEEAVTRSTA